ncbi:hypothetical protein GCM10011591_23570 [Nocardia camponoti]|uniref:Uncharacterized protein n=1 Tax=Nocardia camponoti TaxID=1616106 RepID=A0A917QHS7_9NOCA|nr:hypothetical protein GCM10011591_23570 [Nocardia camponoti]
MKLGRDFVVRLDLSGALLSVYALSWRIDGPEGAVVGSQDSPRFIDVALASLVLKRLTAIEVQASSLDTVFFFEDLRLRIFPETFRQGDGAPPFWTLKGPDRKFGVGWNGGRSASGAAAEHEFSQTVQVRPRVTATPEFALDGKIWSLPCVPISDTAWVAGSMFSLHFGGGRSEIPRRRVVMRDDVALLIGNVPWRIESEDAAYLGWQDPREEIESRIEILRDRRLLGMSRNDDGEVVFEFDGLRLRVFAPHSGNDETIEPGDVGEWNLMLASGDTIVGNARGRLSAFSHPTLFYLFSFEATEDQRWGRDPEVLK